MINVDDVVVHSDTAQTGRVIFVHLCDETNDAIVTIQKPNGVRYTAPVSRFVKVGKNASLPSA